MSYFGEEAGGQGDLHTMYFMWEAETTLTNLPISALSSIPLNSLASQADLSTVVCGHHCRPRGPGPLRSPTLTGGSVGFAVYPWTALGKPPTNLFSSLHCVTHIHGG